jgi:hypothetical protein
MARFRSLPTRASPDPPFGGLPVEVVRRVAADAIHPAHFYAGPGLELEWEHAEQEECSWEVFRGRLLDPAHTRQRRRFEAWNVYRRTAEGRSAEPLLALKLDAAAEELHVVRGLESYVWEGYDSGGGVYLSRERRKWVRELVGTVPLRAFATAAELRDELSCRLFHAVVGASRLPLLSVEAPLPAFSFGELLYCSRPDADPGPLREWRQLVRAMLSPPLSWLERAKLLEALLRAVPPSEVDEAARVFVERWSELGETPERLAGLLRTLFNEVSLSPYTDFAEKTLAFLRALAAEGYLSAGQVVDFLGYLLRQLGRHLTAYDLVTFHHRGANYPDALLLDAALKEYLAWAGRRPDLFADSAGERWRKRLRRRALRQGWLLRRRYEGHAVPDLPTSPGENARVLPPGHPRVPEEQILQPGRRKRRLYDGDPLPPPDLLRQGIADLQYSDELRELGTALFLDRPFGAGKAPGEQDSTLLLASEAFSRSVAAERLRFLARETGALDEGALLRLEVGLKVPGLPLDRAGGASRPGAVSLADARGAAPDFVLRRTTPGSLAALLAQFDFTPLAERFSLDFLFLRREALVARSAEGAGVLVYDLSFRPRLELLIPADGGYAHRAGLEYPAGGLLAVRVWEEAPVPGEPRLHDLRAAPIVLQPR